MSKYLKSPLPFHIPLHPIRLLFAAIFLDLNTGVSGMTGTIKANIQDYYVKGTVHLIDVTGITAPTADKLSYQWDITDSETNSVWGPVVKLNVPEASSSFTVKVHAKADAYYTASTTKTATIIAGNYTETVMGVDAGNVFTDVRDGREYHYKTIGSYDWLAQNLNWAGAGVSYKGESGYDIIFGRLYSWDEATRTTDAICPPGWRLPNNAEWEDLGAALNDGAAVSFEAQWPQLGSHASADATVNGKKLWPYDPDNIKGNTTGWNALPAGKATAGGTSNDNGRYGYWWSATEYNATEGYYRYIIYNNASFYFNYGDKDGLYLSVRCVR